jgi:hypothetical protein
MFMFVLNETSYILYTYIYHNLKLKPDRFETESSDYMIHEDP